MKMTRSRSILIALLLSVSFVIPACTSKSPMATEAPAQKATPSLTATATETPAPIYTPTSTVAPAQELRPEVANSDSSISVVSSSASFLGCWSGGPLYDGVSLVRATYVFESNNTYSAKQEIRSQYVNQNLTWKGTWKHDGDYILAVSGNDDSKVTFQILSGFTINQVGQNFNYTRC